MLLVTFHLEKSCVCGCLSSGDSWHSLKRLIDIYFEINCISSNFYIFQVAYLEIYLAVNF
jgi:hypothetical protein